MAAEDPSAWRNFPKPRVEPRPVGRPRKSAALTPFRGYPAEVIAEWCAVKVSTAYAYKSGRLKPSSSVLKLWRLYVDRQVLPEGWQKHGWSFNREKFVDPEGCEFDQGLLRAYRQIIELAHELARRTGDERHVERVWELLKTADEDERSDSRPTRSASSAPRVGGSADLLLLEFRPKG